jgi:uncharacterized membrane protein YgaE (UPF0421/DUF939 family)
MQAETKYKPFNHDNEQLSSLADMLHEQLNAALTWDELRDGRREELTRACNAAELALALINQCDIRKSVTI